MTSINLRQISFGATKEEIKNIKRACNELSEKIKDNEPVSVTAGTAEVGGKLFISSVPKTSGKSKLTIKYARNKDSFVCTNLTEGTNKENISYIKKTVNQQKIAELLDEFKRAISHMQERDCD